MENTCSRLPLGTGLEGCNEDYYKPSGTYSFEWESGRVEFNGNLYGEIDSLDGNSITVKRISLNKYINGSLVVIKINQQT